ncbi:hypothetical protein DYH10_02725 [Candidatus Saccharibacteria bacterium CPR2]|nr:hypothetical protein [Candidatus Saccharibacteria bacterium CPR2]
MHVIGITGAIGHGKSTLAKYLLDDVGSGRIIETSEDIVSVANNWLRFLPESLKTNPPGYELLNDWIDSLADVIRREGLGDINAKKLHVSELQIESREQSILKLLEYLENIRTGTVASNEIIGAHNKDNHRPILQWIGGYLVKHYHEGIWFDAINKKIQQAGSDGLKLTLVCGVRFLYDMKVIKDNQGVVVKIERPSTMVADSNEVTEKERAYLTPDTTVLNDSGLNALHETAKVLYDDISSKHLLEKYVCSDFAD